MIESTMKLFFSIPVLLTALVIVARAHDAPSPTHHPIQKCTITTNRVTGRDTIFSLVCRCNNGPEIVGRTVRFLDPHVADTDAQEKLTVHCIEERKAHMARVCAKNAREYEKLAAHVLKRCMALRPKPSAKGFNKKFSFKRNECLAEFRQLERPGEEEALLVCGCTQSPGYIVHPGVTIFRVQDSALGAQAEQDLIKACVEDAIPQFTETCGSLPERFDLRSAQMLNTCCKRARKLLDTEKLKCQAIVPDDISALGLIL